MGLNLPPCFSEQVQWCKEVTEAAIETVDSDIKKIDRKIYALLKERASKTVVRARLEQRVESLEKHGKTEAAGFQEYKATYQSREKDMQERKRQAEVGVKATDVLRLGLAELLDAMRGEIATLRTKAHELQLDVAADCAAAYKLGHNANYLLGYYQEEHKAAMEAAIASETAKYRLAVRQMLDDKAQEHTEKINTQKKELEADIEAIADFKASTERLNAGVAAQWSFLCSNALRGPAAAGSTRITVRTSEANRDAWDGDDRELEHPEVWNEEMKREADQQLLMLTDG
jgi:hypothetical protein